MMEGIRRGWRGAIALICIGVTSGCGSAPWKPSSIAIEQQPLAPSSRACLNENAFRTAVEKASLASRLAQTAGTREEWQTVVLSWLQAIERMQAVSGDDPKWAFAQKKVAEYQHYLAIAQQQARRLPRSLPFSSFNSQILNEKLWLFLSYLAVRQTPDILIIGSSRALQGVDPVSLQKNLSSRGHTGIEVFNLGINGATARVVDVLLREILTPEQLPDLVIWADGARALNSGRPDLTYRAIASSVGYQDLLRGQRPTLPVAVATPPHCPQIQGFGGLRSRLASWLGGELKAVAAEFGAIDARGFLAVERRFDRDRYYEQFPDVPGRYDADYQNFTLTGEQTEALARLHDYLQQRQIPLVFVNLPVTRDYLDETRQQAEILFRAFMAEKAQQAGFTFIDLGEGWRDREEKDRNQYFANPSHLNRDGAVLVGEQLVKEPRFPYNQAKNPESVSPTSETIPPQFPDGKTILLPTRPGE